MVMNRVDRDMSGSSKDEKSDWCAVTGASGYLGRYLVNYLLGLGRNVLIVTRNAKVLPFDVADNRLRFLEQDITESFTFPTGIRTVFHCAGKIEGTEQQLFDANVTGAEKVAEAAMKRSMTMIHVSSAGVSGKGPQLDIYEETPCFPAPGYERSKYDAEIRLSDYRKRGLDLRTIRPTIIVGPGRNPQNDSFLHLLRAIQRGRYVSIGTGIYNIIPVREVVRAMVHLEDASNAHGETYIINMPVSFSEFAQVAARAMGRSGSFVRMPYCAVWIGAAVMEQLARLSGRPFPLTFSRVEALTDKRVFHTDKLLNQESFIFECTPEKWIDRVVEAYNLAGLLGGASGRENQ